MYILGQEEVDPKVLLRALSFFYTRIVNHIKDNEHISDETIKYYIDRMLEMTLTLEACAYKVYNELPEDEKKKLQAEEKKRNQFLLVRTDGTQIRHGREEIIEFLKHNDEKYMKLRKDILNRLITTYEEDK